MTREEKQKAIDALKISAPVKAVTQEEFTTYIQTLNKIMDWLEQEPCEDATSRQAAIDAANDCGICTQKILDLPSTQLEIVRCKDCKRRNAEIGFCEGRGWPMQLVPDDGFCDKGERSEE